MLRATPSFNSSVPTPRHDSSASPASFKRIHPCRYAVRLGRLPNRETHKRQAEEQTATGRNKRRRTASGNVPHIDDVDEVDGNESDGQGGGDEDEEDGTADGVESTSIASTKSHGACRALCPTSLPTYFVLHLSYILPPSPPLFPVPHSALFESCRSAATTSSIWLYASPAHAPPPALAPPPARATQTAESLAVIPPLGL
ncbi:hypothetical protein B0H13DRAFT_2307112 [Mycena leptocephala]|nr:hypothetical protein B0H13DRAFT_2307112 [Mycena leptocephala]